MGGSVSFEFNDTNWNTPQTAVFTAFQTGAVKVKVGNDGGNGENALQTLAILGTEGSFKLTSPLFTGGTTGRLFLEFGTTVAVAVVLSGVVALTLTPMLSSLLLRSTKARRRTATSTTTR